jgi:hypothetical protein
MSVAEMTACAPPAPQKTALTCQVSVFESRKIALVAPSAPLARIADLEDAAPADTGCRATAIKQAYDAANQDRSVIVPASLYRGFGGQLPVTLECA